MQNVTVTDVAGDTITVDRRRIDPSRVRVIATVAGDSSLLVLTAQQARTLAVALFTAAEASEREVSA